MIETGQLSRTQVPYPANVRFEMKNLKADTIYRIELRAHNVIGFSAPAEILLRTAKGQFDKPIYSWIPYWYSPRTVRLSLVKFNLLHYFF